MKKFSLFFSLMLCCAALFAQRQQISVDYMNPVFEELPFNMFGKMTYSYIVGENGQNVKDGALSVNCKVNKKEQGWVDGRYRTITIVGTSTINATYQQGLLNGAMTSNYKATLNDGVKTENKTASMSGSFVKGVPNGAFTVKRNAGLKTTLNANYKNGVLVGAYSCSLLDDDSHLAQVSGTLTQSGVPTGVWKVDDDKLTFQNGVLISESTSEYTTRPAVVELAKKYAAGTITKEQLAEKNIIVLENTLMVGDYARIAIFRDSGVEFGDLGGYDFTISNNIKYEYMKELVSLTDAAVDILAQNVDTKLRRGNIEMDESIFYDFGATSLYKCLYYDNQYDLYYICMTKERQGRYLNPKYITGTVTSNTIQAYLSPKQKAVIDEVADKYYAERPYKLISVIYNYIKNEHYSSKALSYLDGERDCAVPVLKEIQKEVNEAYQKFVSDSVSHKSNADIVFWKWNEYEPNAYIAKSTIAGMEFVIAEIDEKIAKAEAEAKAREEARLKAEAEAKAKAEAEAKAQLTPIFEFIIAKKKASNMTYDTNFEKYFICEKRTEYWRLDASKILKPFCPIIGYEILEVTENTVKCRLIQKGKKKTTPTYEIELKYKKQYERYGDPMLILESFDFNNAKLVE